MHLGEWRAFLRDEVIQRREEGCDVGDLGERVEALPEMPEESALQALTGELAALQPRDDFAYQEPSTLDEIRTARPEGPRDLSLDLGDDVLADKMYGAWLGRAAGCMVGKPVEGKSRDFIERYLREANAYPLDNYFPPLGSPSEEFAGIGPPSVLVGGITHALRDDDLDYPMLGLHTLEIHGLVFSTENMIAEWLSHLSYHMVYTAERNAYRNLVNGLRAPECAGHINPHREWIGAQIRADIFGWTAPGQPQMAAWRAFRDARLSHVKNGIYGEMFVAAMLAAAFAADDRKEIVEIGLSEIPAKSRLAEAVRDTVEWCGQCGDWTEVWDRVNRRYGHYHPVHTMNNACMIVLGLLKGEGDFTKTVCVTVMCGLDTDCTGATAGSLAGVMLGAKGIPAKFADPLNDRVEGSVVGFTDCRLSDLARRTQALAAAGSA